MYISPKTRAHIEKTLIKLNICFLIKNDKLLEKYNEIGKKLKTVWNVEMLFYIYFKSEAKI